MTKHDETIEREAEVYARVSFAGHNKLGQPMYTAENLNDLEWRQVKMDAFRAGAQAERKRAEKLVEALRKVVERMESAGLTGKWLDEAKDALKEWESK